MAEAIIMPKTGMAMEEGSIIEWLVKEGDTVSTGDPVAEIETDKSTMELESDFSGTILKILYEEGSTVPVVKTIAWIGDPGEDIPEEMASEADDGNAADGSTTAAAGSPSTAEAAAGTAADIRPAAAQISGGRVMATPAARRVASERGIPLESISPSGSRGEIREQDVLDHRIQKATHLARRIAAGEGIDLAGISGSGHDGKILAADLAGRSAAGAPAAALAAPGAAAEDTRVPLTRIQQITGRRMLQSHTEIPTVTMNTRADVTEMLKVRKSLNESVEGKITINDFVLKAVTAALRENPRLNAVLDGDDLIYKGEINLNMAVATGQGLLVPVMRGADRLSLSALSRQAADIASRGREGKLGPDDMEGGTFTVSNIGMYGIDSFSPIINQPQAAILGVCAIEDKLVLEDGEVRVRKMMGLSLTFDHRIADGAEASIFFSRIRELLEKPLAVLA